MSVEVKVFGDAGEVASAAAETVARRLREEPRSVLLLPTGHTSLGMYRRLVEMHERGGLSFAGATVFNLDEYLGLPADHPESFARYMWENLYRHVDADARHTRIPDGTAPDPRRECERYEAAIEAAGGVDLCVLGIGRNGHVGFNEPGAPFGSRTGVVELSRSTRRANGAGFPEGLAPEHAITVGLGTILESRQILLLAAGAQKAGAVAAAAEGGKTRKVPASALRDHPACSFVLDRSSAGLLREAGA